MLHTIHRVNKSYCVFDFWNVYTECAYITRWTVKGIGLGDHIKNVFNLL